MSVHIFNCYDTFVFLGSDACYIVFRPSQQAPMKTMMSYRLPRLKVQRNQAWIARTAMQNPTRVMYRLHGL